MQIQRFSLYKQIELFQGTQQMIKAKIGGEAAGTFFQNALYVVALGSNDFINNFLLPVYQDSWAYNGETFNNYLASTLGSQLRVGTNNCELMRSKKKCVADREKLQAMRVGALTCTYRYCT